MKKLVEKLLSWCKKSMKMRRCVGKSTAPVTGQSVGQTENAEGVLPSMATETVAVSSAVRETTTANFKFTT